jgi:hypothetical protein
VITHDVCMYVCMYVWHDRGPRRNNGRDSESANTSRKYIHTYIHTYTYIRTYTYVHIHTYIHIHAHIHTYTGDSGRWGSKRLHTFIHTYLHTYIHTQVIRVDGALNANIKRKAARASLRYVNVHICVCVFM